MKPPSLTASLATILLTGTLGCSKKDEPAVSPTGTGSYTLDGTVRNCEVKGTLFPTSNSQAYDQLDINLTTVPQPSWGEEHLILSFTKQSSQPTTAYKLLVMGYYDKGYGTSGVIFDNAPNTTLQELKGTYSGAFSGATTPSTGAAWHTISLGSFVNTRP